MPTKEQILGAAISVIKTKGLSRATTREIAREAGCAEGSIYKHFQDKDALLMGALQESAPPFILLMKQLEDQAGHGTVRSNLERVAREAVAFFFEVMPVSTTVFSQPELLAEHRRFMKANNLGPQRAYEALAAYMKAEQKLGRISSKARPLGAAALLLGACYHHAFFQHLLDPDVVPIDNESFPAEAVRALLEGLVVRS